MPVILTCVVSRVLSVIPPVPPGPPLPSLYGGGRDRSWERLRYFLEAGFPSTTLFPSGVRQFLVVGCPVHRGTFSSIPGLYQLMQVAAPKLWQPKMSPDMATCPWEGQVNNQLTTPGFQAARLVFSGGGIWTERCVTQELPVHCFQRITSSFGMMTTQGGELIPWR